jgi:hypothetical protein
VLQVSLTGTQIPFPGSSGFCVNSGLEVASAEANLCQASGYVTADRAEANYYQENEVLFFLI